ncbi:MAG: hypothetical protein ABSG95_15400 [Solirubrobacteraceae bacterium]
MKSVMESHRLGSRSIRRYVPILVAISAPLGVLGGASPALAKKTPNPEFTPFANCPISAPAVTKKKRVAYCLVANTTSGEFKVGSKTVTINKPITLQGGLIEGSRELVPATNGETLSKTPLTIPGGLVGVGDIGGEVTATTELAGPVLINESVLTDGDGAAVELPIKVKLSNPTLGNECYIGSDSAPVVLHLTTGTTSPPSPNTPIHGNPGTASFNEAFSIVTIEGTSLVDNSFAAPGVTGCGESLSALLDPVVDEDAGLPSAAGSNTAILNGSLKETSAQDAKKSGVIPKAKKQ